MWGQGDPWGLWCPGIRGRVIPGGLGIGGEVAAVGDSVSEGTRGVGSALPHSGQCQWVSEGVLGSLSWYGGVGGSTSPQGEGAAVGTARQRGVTAVVSLTGSSVMFYLAAAVSDFYIPASEMPEHKIQSSEGPLQVRDPGHVPSAPPSSSPASACPSVPVTAANKTREWLQSNGSLAKKSVFSVKMRRANFHVSRIARKYPCKAASARKAEMSSWWVSEDKITVLRITELF